MGIDLRLDEGEGLEIVSPHGDKWIWTRKQANVPARGTVAIDGRELRIDDVAFIDDSAGYHAHRTAWRWSAGHGRLDDGRAVGWNLVDGVHDGDPSERTVWVDGEPHEVGPLEFADDLSRVGGLEFSAWSERTDRTNLAALQERLPAAVRHLRRRAAGRAAAGRGLWRDGGARCPLVRT